MTYNSNARSHMACVAAEVDDNMPAAVMWWRQPNRRCLNPTASVAVRPPGAVVGEVAVIEKQDIALTIERYNDRVIRPCRYF